MNTITQLENALKAIDQARLQNLINHLLHLQGNKFIGAPGAVVGKDKTSKGTPDAFFVNGDKYIFVECTTQERIGQSKTLVEKLSKDIDHCFNEGETTIGKEKIEKVILACNEKISVEEHQALSTKVKSYNPHAQLDVFNIQNLPMYILEFPKLAGEYLGIETIKGDIYTLDQFLQKTTKGLQPSLTNEFIGREEELKDSKEALKNNDILLLSGGGGVGKSKLAVRILEELAQEDYTPIVIQSSAVSLWDDYHHLFLPGRKYIILFDDANKSVANLEYLLSKLEASPAFTAKVIITSRDYVKKQVSGTLQNRLYKELPISEFKDAEIEKIIVAALPNLKYHHDIKGKVIELAKGNARVALMSTHSVTTGAQTNYLDSPVLLYEKYFEKISEEIGIFNKPITLQSLAIVSFFGVLDRNNEELKTTLATNFGIDWDEMWTAIIELHSSEILDVYSNEIVKVSDQVLATYAFYKCFIDPKSAVINYAEWIIAFIDNFPKRVHSTLIDTNNTFAYHHVRELVLPHLKQVIDQVSSDEKLYTFYDLFWFYKGRVCLLYLRQWIENLEQEGMPQQLEFSYVHNDHTTASKYFELLGRFWRHSNELLKPSLELTLTMLEKQPSRLPETLKFFHDYFTYKIEDIDNGYFRQNILLDVLLAGGLSGTRKKIAQGILLNMSQMLFGWHYTEYGPAKGQAFTIYNFDLYKSDALMKLRERMLSQFYHLFDPQNKDCEKILHQIIYPDGDMDKSIYIDELPIYQKLIAEKLDNKQLSHCNFVSALAECLNKAAAICPDTWYGFINSDIRKLSNFLNPDRAYQDGMSFEQSEQKKRQEIDDFIKSKDWTGIEHFLLNIDSLYRQQTNADTWIISQALTDIYISIARKNKEEFENALRLFFSGKVQYPLEANILNVVMSENIMTGQELLKMLNDYQFTEKTFWQFVLMAALPAEQVNQSFLYLLIDTFPKPGHVYIHAMLSYLKYEAAFEEYKKGKTDLEHHNIITYLTSILIKKYNKTSLPNFGYHFCADCAPYFTHHPNLLKDAYWKQHEARPHFDHNGEELKAILDIDRNFVNDSVKNGKIGLRYSSPIRLEKVNAHILWDYDEYETLVEDLLLTILEKTQLTFSSEKGICSLFKSKRGNHDNTGKIKALITKLTQKCHDNERMVLLLIEVVYNNYRDWFIAYFRDFLLINKDINLVKKIGFDRSSSTTGSWVPVYQQKIQFYQDILAMMNTLPDILDYAEHISYFEQRIVWKKNDIEREQKRDFMDEFY